VSGRRRVCCPSEPWRFYYTLHREAGAAESVVPEVTERAVGCRVEDLAHQALTRAAASLSALGRAHRGQIVGK
jgi:hypothetical protein